MQQIHLDEYHRRVRQAEGGRLGRIFGSPVHFTWSKVVQTAHQKFGISRRTTARTFWGEPMQVVLPELVSAFIYRYGFFEAGLTKIFLEFIRPGMTVFDVGAHFGYFTLLASELVGNSGQVHSFDPTPSTFEILRQNASNRKNVRPQNLAMFSTETSLPFNDFGLKFAAFNSLHGAKMTDEERDRLAPKQYQVNAVSMDRYIEKSGIKPDFVKVDAEGAEMDILRGMERTLAEVCPILTMEMGDPNKSESPKSPQIVQFLIARGYRALNYTDGRIVPHVPQDRYSYDNLLFVKP